MLTPMITCFIPFYIILFYGLSVDSNLLKTL